MAEVTAMRNNALPYPVYGCAWTVVFPMLDADGDLVTGATTPDSEVSKNGDTFADCTNEATEIATSSGIYYLTLTGTEMTADIVAVIAKSATTGMKTTPIVLYPRKLVQLATGTSQGGDTGYITLAAGTVLYDGQYDGCLCVATIDSNAEARILQACTQSNQQCTVTPAWNVAPDADDTYIIYLPEGRKIPTVDVKAISGDTAAADNLESACDNYSATRGLAGTALPNAAADAAGGLPISDTGGLDMDAILADTDELQKDLVNGGRLDLLIDGIKTKTDLLPAVAAGAADGLVIGSAAYKLAVDSNGKVAVPDTQKVDVNTIKTVAVAATATVTFQNGTIPITTDILNASAVAAAVWDAVASSYDDAGSMGALLNDAGAAGDPWNTALPGAYSAGKAGYILGTNLAAIYGATEKAAIDLLDDASGGLADIHTDIGTMQTMLTDIHGTDLPAVKTDTAAIKLKTDNLPSDPADQSAVEAAITSAHSTTNGKIDAVDDYVDTEIGTLVTELAKVPKSDGAVSWNATALAAIQGECTDALNAYDPPTKAELDTAQGAVTVSAIANNAITEASINNGAITNAKVADDVDVNVKTITAGAITAAAIANGAIDAATFAADVDAEIAAMVWNALYAAYGVAGSYGEALETILSNAADILTDTGTTLDGKINTIDTVVDLIEDIVRNQLEVTDANGNVVLRADDNVTALFTVAACVTDDLTTTIRKRLA